MTLGYNAIKSLANTDQMMTKNHVSMEFIITIMLSYLKLQRILILRIYHIQYKAKIGVFSLHFSLAPFINT